jgi:hypothetical protein
MDGGSRTGQVIDFINLNIERKSYIVPHNLKMVIVHEVLDVVLGSGKKIIKTDDVVLFLEQSFA